MAEVRKAFQLAGETIAPGEHRKVRLHISVLADHTPIYLTAVVFHGKKPGPTVFVSGAIHGDEIIGVEIIRQLMANRALAKLSGTVIFVPVVNAYGFVVHSRYLPDRRDLNRSFPGSAKGPLASQLADHFMRRIVARCDFGIDLHSGAIHRSNLPQIRAELSNAKVLEAAQVFGAPIILDAKLRDGSLREAAQEGGCNVLLYEAGEALRFDERGIRFGVRGVLNVLRHLGMLPPAKSSEKRAEPIRALKSAWVRAPIGGILRTRLKLGQHVAPGALIGSIGDPVGEVLEQVYAANGGIVIGRVTMPIVHRGDALFHIAEVDDSDAAADVLDAIEEIDSEPLFSVPVL